MGSNSWTLILRQKNFKSQKVLLTIHKGGQVNKGQVHFQVLERRRRQALPQINSINQPRPNLWDLPCGSNNTCPRFKGIIQNVQLRSLAGGVEEDRIVLFFKEDRNLTKTNKGLESVGDVEIVDVLKGEVRIYIKLEK